MPISLNELAADMTIGMAAHEVVDVPTAARLLAPGTGINIGFIDGEDMAQRTAAARAIAEAGLVPVPHLSARRLPSEAILDEFLTILEADGACADVFVIGGDPDEPAGPYSQALHVLQSGLLERRGVRAVSIGGYPEGHPKISDDDLWQALERKAALLTREGRAGDIISQLTINPEATITWIEQVRARGIDMPIRVGVPGPVCAETFLDLANQYGSATNGRIAERLGLADMDPEAIVTADAFVEALAERLDPAVHGKVRLHAFSFGALAATATWLDGLGLVVA
jgi:methylenetetrahydrofolate reductase (NADPH)